MNSKSVIKLSLTILCIIKRDPEFILPDNYSKSQNKERMNEGSLTIISNFIDHHLKLMNK